MRLLQSERFQGLVKAILLLGTGMFLYGRIANGTLFYYINEKFAGFTLFGVVGLIAVGLAYQFGKKTAAAAQHDHAHHDNEGHDHNSHGHDHSHALSWGGVLLVALPVILGLAVPPRPLGASALDNREVVMSVESSALPAVVRAAAKSAEERNILDWWRSFQANNDYGSFTNQEAKVTGFVYKDPSYGDGHFLATRFIVSCCVADAAVVGLVVRWPDAVTLADDQWVEVSGKFAPSTLDSWKPPLLVAETVTLVDTPAQPYLYP
jgi:putative membrane protein